ncbi:MAG: peptidylprolyl isomerase [Kofleriaceae bacterium]
MSLRACARVALVTGMMTWAAGCGGRSCPPTTPATDEVPAAARSSSDPVVARVEAYAQAVCACTALACTEAAEGEISAWAEANRDALAATLADPLRSMQFDGAAGRATACMHALAKAAPADDDQVAATLASLDGLADQLCACADATCGGAVVEQIKAVKDPGRSLTEEENARAEALGERVSTCWNNLTAPPPPAAAADPRLTAPVAADLARYLKRVKGKGALTATIATNLGTLHCRLEDQRAPMTVANFVGLATGQKPWLGVDGTVQEGAPFFDGLRFHRIIPDFMIQGGDPDDAGTGGPGYTFADELDAALRLDGPGRLAMANRGPDTNGSQFFITLKATPWLDGKHTVFGTCAELDVVAKIGAVARDDHDRPTRPVIIRHVSIGRQ